MSNLVPSIYPTTQEFALIKEMAEMAVKSGFLPTSVNTKEKAVIIALKGRELNLQPLIAWSQISVINGKPCMSAELMLSQIYRTNPSAIINFIKNDNECCTLEVTRKNTNKSTWTFTIQDAATAGLLSKAVWRQYPAAMLRARAISAMARAVFPDALNGVSYTAEEMNADVEIAEDGSETIKDVTPIVKKEEKPVEPKEEPKPIDLPPWKIILNQMNEEGLNDDQKRMIIKRVFCVDSFKDLTKNHLESFRVIMDERRSLNNEYESLLLQDEHRDKTKKLVEEFKNENPAQVQQQEEVERQSTSTTMPVQEPILDKIPDTEKPLKPRNMALGEVVIPASFPSLVNFGKIKLIPRKNVDVFLLKASEWPKSEELNWMINSLKGYWGL